MRPADTVHFNNCTVSAQYLSCTMYSKIQYSALHILGLTTNSDWIKTHISFTRDRASNSSQDPQNRTSRTNSKLVKLTSQAPRSQPHQPIPAIAPNCRQSTYCIRCTAIQTQCPPSPCVPRCRSRHARRPRSRDCNHVAPCTLSAHPVVSFPPHGALHEAAARPRKMTPSSHVRHADRTSLWQPQHSYATAQLWCVAANVVIVGPPVLQRP